MPLSEQEHKELRTIAKKIRKDIVDVQEGAILGVP